MYQSETMDAVRDAAQMLTREGKVLTIGNPEFPLAVFADTYKVDAEPTNTELPQEEMVAIEEHFDEINQDTTPVEDNSRESVAANLGAAVSKVQFNTTNIIIPSIKAMHQHYAGMQAGSSQPELSVTPWRYLAPHNSPVLVNHINTRYTNVQPKDSYRSFILNTQTVESIIELMAVNNPHLEQEEVTEWALKVGTERIEAVWNSLFASGGHVIPTGLQYLSAQSAPFNVDDILVAYFICGHYIDNPVVVPNVSVDLEDWEHSMKLMHEMFGFYLSRAYMRRADQREQGALILRNDAVNPIATRKAVVIVNGDVFDPWVAGGGDIQAILGAAVENGGVTDVKHIDAGANRFIERWHELFPLVKQAAIDHADRQRMNNVIVAFREVGRTEPLKDRFTAETEKDLIAALRYIRREDYDNPYKVFSSLICRVYFPESTYLEYLDAIDQFGQTFPRASIRELATQAMITLVAIFQAKQIQVEGFIPEIDPNGGDSTGPMDDSGLIAIAGDSEEAAEEVDMTSAGTDDQGEAPEIGGDEADVGVPAEDLGVDTDGVGADTDFGGVAEEPEEDPYADLETTDDGDEVPESEEPEAEESEVIEEESEVAEVEESEAAAEEVPEVEEAEEEQVEEKSEDEPAEDEEDETPLS